MRTLWGLPVLLLGLLARGFAQDTQTAYCDYADGNQVSMQYSVSAKETPKNGRVWSPGITLFVQVPLTLAGSEIPIGAYTIHLIPDKKNRVRANRNLRACQCQRNLHEQSDARRPDASIFGRLFRADAVLHTYLIAVGIIAVCSLS